MISTMAIDQAQRRVQAFQQRCGAYGEAALHLAYHAALPVALNAALLHLLRINFFLDPPEILPYTVEFEFLLSPLCREIDEGLYEIEPEIRDVLLAGLSQTYGVQRTHDIATLLWQYVDRHSPWFDRVELERAQQLTALNFLNPEKAQQWLVTVETEVSQGQVAAREWFVAMRKDIENQAQRSQNEEAFTALVHALSDQSSGVRHRAVEALGRIGNDKAISALLKALNDTSSKVRLSAALALGQIGSDNAVDALLLILQDEDSNVRSGAAKALGQIGDNRAVSALLKTLKDKNRTVRSTAADALAQMGHDNKQESLRVKLPDQGSDWVVLLDEQTEIEPANQDWWRKRQLDGSLNRVPKDFYPSVWQLLHRCKGLVIGDKLERRNRLDSERLITEMTAGEKSFALKIEHLLNKIQAPEYRQVNVEAMMELATIAKRNPDFKVEESIVLDVLIGHAVRLAWLDKYPDLFDRYDEHKGSAWRSFYESSPYDCASYIAKAMRFLTQLG